MSENEAYALARQLQQLFPGPEAVVRGVHGAMHDVAPFRVVIRDRQGRALATFFDGPFGKQVADLSRVS